MVFFILIISCLLLLPHLLLDSLANFLSPAHQWCVQKVPPISTQEIVSALVCGERIHNQRFVNFFSRSGLYHLVIVSKTHLTLISTFTGFIGSWKNSKFAWLPAAGVIAAYVCLCGPQAPLVRCGIYLLLFWASWIGRLGWSRVFCLLMATCICLAGNFQWYTSLSLLHSSGCALALFIAQELLASVAAQVLVGFLLTAPYLYGWANLHPLTMVFNLIAAPFLMLIWMPLALIGFSIPKLAIFTDQVIFWTMKFIDKFLEPIPEVQSHYHLSETFLWIYFFTTGLYIWYRRRKLKSQFLCEREATANSNCE